MIAGARAAFAASLLALAACGMHAPPPLPGSPVRVEGDSHDLRALAGQWTGEFHNERTGQHGTIGFSLEAGRDTAYAQVILVGSVQGLGCSDPVTTATQPAGAREFTLRLGRVSTSGGSVGGWLVPYPDPIAGCLVDTWFEGFMRGDVLEGMYFSHLADGSPIRLGTWRVTRARY